MNRTAVIRLIRQAYQKRLPLNISAVKRREPELLEAVFSGKPIWGWRQALSDAGIDYRSTNVELEEFVTCRICGVEFTTLASHLYWRHKVSGGEYRAEFPNAEFSCESVRAKAMSKHLPPCGVAHWEPVWTVEYAMDRAIELHRMGHPLNLDWVYDNDSCLLAYVSERSEFDSWDAFLRRIGLNPAEIRLVVPMEEWSRKKIISILKERRRKGLPMNTAALCAEGSRLRNAMRRYFGSTRKALRAAGINPASVSQVEPYSHEEIEQVYEAVRRIGRLPESRRRSAWRKFPARSRKIIQRHLGGIEKTCSAVGVDSTWLLARGPYPTRDSVIAAFRERERKGLSAMSSRVAIEDRKLSSAVLREFGSFAAMHKALKIGAKKKTSTQQKAGVM
jgi:hypothetical protein